MSTIRAHIVMPSELVEAIDRLVGRRGRSQFLVKAAEEKLRRERLVESARRAAGSLAQQGTPPEWDTPEGTAEWVRALRAVDEERLRRLTDHS